MPVIQRGVGREHVEIAPALDIPDPNALASFEDDRERLVVVGAPPVGLGEELVDAAHAGALGR